MVGFTPEHALWGAARRTAGRVVQPGLAVLVAASASFLLAVPTASAAPWRTVERASIAFDGGEAGGGVSYEPSLSPDGRYVALVSEAANLVSNDTNGLSDVFVRDRLLGTNERLSVGPTGDQGNGGSYSPAFSSNGRYVSFVSGATNLASGAPAGQSLYVRDRVTGTTEMVAASVEIGRSPISDDGRFIAYATSANVHVLDRVSNTIEPVAASTGGAAPNGTTRHLAMTPDGRYVAFVSYANNLVDGDTNGGSDTFIHDRVTHTTQRVSLDGSGAQAGDTPTVRFPLRPPSISADGRYVSFIAKFALDPDVNAYVRDRAAGTTEAVSVSNAGIIGNDRSNSTSISADGRYVAFASQSDNLVAGDTTSGADVFVRDRALRTTSRATLNEAGEPSQATASLDWLWPRTAISAGAGVVAFDSLADDLVAGDRNNRADTFIATVDTRAPDTSISLASKDGGPATPRTFSFASSERNSTFECRLDVGSFTPCSGSYTTPQVADGAHRVEVRATDSASNTDPTPAVAEFAVDTTAPLTTLDEGPAGTTDDATPTFRFHANEAGAAFSCRVDAAAFAPCRSPYTTVALRGGPHTFSVRAGDAAGNDDPTPATRSFAVKRSTPDFRVLGIVFSGRKRPRLTLTGISRRARVTVICLKPCGSKRQRGLADRRQLSKRRKSMVLTLKRPALRATSIEIRVALPGRLVRYKRYGIRHRAPVLKTTGCLSRRARSIDCPA